MTYFRVDDKFWSHPKTTSLSMAARGLWATAGSWAACYLTDGYIPRSSLRSIAGGANVKKAVDELVTAGLWIDVGDGWQYHQWDEHNYNRAQVEQQRQRRRKNQDAWRARKEMKAMLNGQQIGSMP